MLFGILLGYLLALTTISVTYIVISKNKSSVIKAVENITTKPVFTNVTKEKISILRRPTESEEAYKHILEINKDRGGIPDSELK